MWTEIYSFALGIIIGITVGSYVTSKYLNQNNFTLGEEIVGKIVIDATDNMVKDKIKYIKKIFSC